MAWRKRAGRTMVAAGLIGVVGVGMTRFAPPHDPMLLDKAHRVKLTEAYPQNPYAYQWLTDYNVLALISSGTKDKEAAAQIDTTTGKATPFPLLSGRTRGSFYTCQLSPDRNWMLSTDRYGGTATIVSRDGKQQVTRGKKPPGPLWNTGQAMWLPDSRRWVVLWADLLHLYAAVEDRDVPGISIWIPLGSRHEYWSVPLECLRLLGTMQNDHILAVNPFSLVYDTSQVKFTEFGARPGPAQMRDYTLQLPEGMTARKVALSPQGDRLAWIMWVHPSRSPLITFLQQRWPWLGRTADERGVLRLGISRLDGTDLKWIGRMPKLPPGDEYELGDLRWLPGGKSLSFAWKKTLWTVAASD